MDKQTQEGKEVLISETRGSTCILVSAFHSTDQAPEFWTLLTSPTLLLPTSQRNLGSCRLPSPDRSPSSLWIFAIASPELRGILSSSQLVKAHLFFQACHHLPEATPAFWKERPSPLNCFMSRPMRCSICYCYLCSKAGIYSN